MNPSVKIASAIAILSAASVAFVEAADVQDSFVRREQQEQARERIERRDDRREQVQVKIEEKSEVEMAPAQTNAAAFYVDEIILDDVPDEAGFLEEMAEVYEGRTLSLEDIRALVAAMNRKLLDKGYVTSRVVIPEQNILSGMLHLRFAPGRLGRVVYSAESDRLPWENAFPIREGDLLNVRLLEEGLEQMKRLRSLDVSMRILPADAEGVSNLELTIHAKKQVYGNISIDDSGMKETGKYQWTGTFGAERLFNANDIFQFSVGFDGSREGGEKGTRAPSFCYSIPRGKDTFTIRHNRYNYHQTVASVPYDFISKGKVRTTRFSYEHMISRSAAEKRSFDVSLIKRDSHNFINDMEIPVQALDTAALEIGLADRIYIGRDTLYLRAALKQGMGWFGAQKENSYADGPKTRYKKWIFDADWYKPFTMGHRPAMFSSTFHGEWNAAGKRLYGVDMVSIGNRYTVRGFDGEYTLMGESGWYLRNELASTIPKIHSEIYFGLDVGSVYGVSTDTLVGRTIAGAALGMRGTFSSGISYDAFISRAIYKPDGYHTRVWVPGFMVSCRF